MGRKPCLFLFLKMKIGYPCINRSIGCTANSTFRLASYSEENLIDKIGSNLRCLSNILEFNLNNNILFFRISSDLVPFASHPVCKFDWLDRFKKAFRGVGSFIKKNKMRISMHPDQFVLINAKDKEIVKRSIKELEYHCDVLDAMKLDSAAKVQIHVGGAYGDKRSSMQRFIENYNELAKNIKKRLCIENDDRSYSLRDCLEINKKTGIPVIFDSFHHECLNNKERLRDSVISASKTWKNKDGILMLDYSSQKKGERKGAHTEHIDMASFKDFLKKTKGLDFDMMLEIKDKEKSALEAIRCIR